MPNDYIDSRQELILLICTYTFYFTNLIDLYI